jgi:hypothetical protein
MQHEQRMTRLLLPVGFLQDQVHHIYICLFMGVPGVPESVTEYLTVRCKPAWNWQVYNNYNAILC